MNTQEALLNGHAPPLLIKLIQTNDLDVLPSLAALFHEGKEEESALPVKMTCFVPSQDVKSNIRRAVKESKELSSLPVTIVMQPPLGEHNVLLLIWYINEIPAKLTYNNNCMAVELKNGNQWLFIAQDMDAKESTFEKSAELSLTTMFNNLAHFDFNYHHLLHSWFFIPQITGYSDQKERYQYLISIDGS